jgi:hypothetical protein
MVAFKINSSQLETQAGHADVTRIPERGTAAKF